jgi:hypothetical protein
MVRYKFINQLKNDYVTGVSLIFPVVFWLIYSFQKIFGFVLDIRRHRPQLIEMDASSSVFFFWLTVIISMFFLSLLLYRSISIRKLCNYGSLTDAIITSSSFYKDRGRIEFKFEIDKINYNTGNPVFKNKETNVIKKNDVMEIIYNQKKPKKAFIIKLIGEKHSDSPN